LHHAPFFSVAFDVLRFVKVCGSGLSRNALTFVNFAAKVFRLAL